MQRRICPICEQMWLRPLVAYTPHADEEVLHENEHTIHVVRNGQHFLAKTQQNVLEEMEADRKLVLN